MSALVAAVAGALIVAGTLGAVLAMRPSPVLPATAPTRSRLPGRLTRRVQGLSTRTKQLLVGGSIVGLFIALVTGWFVALFLVPAAVVGVPLLLASSESTAQITRIEAMEEWTRSLSGILTAGVGLEQALIATLRSTPDAIRPEVTRLAGRLRARWGTEEALRAFADELDDATGDLIAGNLILGARRRAGGVAAVLEALAESTAADVRARREIESDRAKPRSTARLVTLITVGALAFMALTGSYIAPYGTPLGQVILVVLLTLYVAVLIWMKHMAKGTKLPRFIGAEAKGGTA
ncbi:MAG: type II secretion system F family protein [Janibacter sp.]|nr:type II secretion system F family protein [Janibacter sp.]